MINKIVLNAYKKTVVEADVPQALKEALEFSPITRAFIRTLQIEFNQVNILRAKQGKRPVKRSIIEETVRDFTLIHLKGIEAKADQRRESEIAKYQRQHAGDAIEDMESTLAGKAKGDFEDLGLEIPEDQLENPEPKELEKPSRIINHV